MGLLRAGFGALGGVLADQWRDYLYAESMDSAVLMVKAHKRENRRSSNTRGDDNIISNGSIIAVNEGQCMLIIDQGKVAELCAEPGEFVYDESTEPSLFYGDLSATIGETFSNIGKRFTFGGDAGKDQRVYFINTKEILGNKYGTASPVPFRVVDRNIGLDIDIAIRCHGEYSYRIVDPLLFYTNVSGNVRDAYLREAIDSQLDVELMTALQPAFAKISEMGVRYSALPGHTQELADALNGVLSKKWVGLRGIMIVSFGVNSVKASDEDEAMIKQLQRSAALRDPNLAAAHIAGAQAEAMMSAAANQGQGPVMAFAGLNMAQNAGGANAASLFELGASKASEPAAGAGWACACGARDNNGKFCAECGAPKPEQGGWVCACGARNTGKFCAECGKPMQPGGARFKCDKCGWEPNTGDAPPKFCPECGDAFDDSNKLQ